MRRELWKEFRNHRMLVLMLFVFQAWTMGSNMHSKWLKHQTRRSVNNILWHLLCAGHHAWLLSGERKETQDSPYLPVYKVAGLNRPRHFGKPFPRKEATFSELMTIVKDKLLSLLQTNVKLCSPKFRRTIKFTSVQSLCRVRLFVTPWTAARQASLSITKSRSPPNQHHWVGDAIQPSYPLFSPSPPALNLSQHQGFLKWVTLHIKWSKYWSFSFNISPFNEHSGLISFRMD